MYHGDVTRKKDPAEDVARAMLLIGRRQRARALARAAGVDPAGEDANVVPVLDAVAQAGETGGECTVTAVARALAVDQPRASRLVARAVAAGLMERKADQHDGRRSLLQLTPRGRGVLAAVHRNRRAAMERAMAGWTPAEREQFAALLTRFVDGLDN